MSKCYFELRVIIFSIFRGSPSHPSMMGGPMPVRGPGQGPRGTGAGMRGQMGRGDYGKYCSVFIFVVFVDISLNLFRIKYIYTRI